MSAVGGYKDYVVARFRSNGKTYLYEAPAFASLKPGTEIDVGGMERPIVLATVTLRSDSEEVEALRVACGTEEIRRVKAKLEYREFLYGEEVF